MHGKNPAKCGSLSLQYINRKKNASFSMPETMDIYNQVHPEETPELIAQSQAALHNELAKLPQEKKVGWLQATEKCPELVKEDHTLMFLRCEVFNADVS
jgi:hypothetical protein